MQKAKIFPNGRSQAIRLPKDFRFDGEEVYISKLNGIVMLFPVTGGWDTLLASLDMFSDDFMVEREAPEADQEREAF
ncbi:MAG: antitoxin [Candidatus Hydrogenedentes bacterium]|jgi:antitoxin VapB|nr:antitoxin [Candidatus Hydrogenedentota bacterium]